MYGVRDSACPLSTRGGTRLVRLVRGRGVCVCAEGRGWARRRQAAGAEWGSLRGEVRGSAADAASCGVLVLLLEGCGGPCAAGHLNAVTIDYRGRAWRFDTFPEMGLERCRLCTRPIGPTRMRTHPHTDSHAWIVSSQLGAASCPLSVDPATLLLQLASLRSSSSGPPAGTASVLCLVSAGRRALSRWFRARVDVDLETRWFRARVDVDLETRWFRVRVDVDPKVLLLLLLLMRRSLTVLVHDRSQRANYVAELRSIAWLEPARGTRRVRLVRGEGRGVST
jgi:hypothetical protein